MDAQVLGRAQHVLCGQGRVLGWADGPRHPQPGRERRSRTRFEQLRVGLRYSRPSGHFRGAGNEGTKLLGEKSGKEPTDCIHGIPQVCKGRVMRLGQTAAVTCCCRDRRDSRPPCGLSCPSSVRVLPCARFQRGTLLPHRPAPCRAPGPGRPPPLPPRFSHREPRSCRCFWQE